MAKDRTCQSNIDMQALEERHKELEKAWNDLLMERREFEARIHALEQREKQFKLKWDLLIQETARFAEDKEQFERRKKFYEQVQSSYMEPYYESDNIVQGEMFFSGVSDIRDHYANHHYDHSRNQVIHIYLTFVDYIRTFRISEDHLEYEGG